MTDDTIQTATEAPAQEEGQDEVSKLKAELEEQKNKYLYLRADFDNFRKQAIKERSDLIRYGGENVIREMLMVLDDLERAASSELTADTLEKYKNGIDLIVSTFKKTLERFGVEEVASKGQPFDPTLHEALSSVDSPDSEPNTVVDVLRKPYKLHGKLIRPGQVVVNTRKKDES